MLLAYGFLRKIFEVFEKYRTPIDMITTSEVAVSLTIDNTLHLKEILLWAETQAVAAQYWTVAGGSATVLKLAHDDAWRPLSPGTVLTGHMIQGLLAEGVANLDFGRGDDDYKALWASLRRPRIGMLLANPRNPEGLLALARHTAGVVLRRTHDVGSNGKLIVKIIIF